MRVMIDTNIFISAVLFPNGKASAALLKALISPYQPVTCDYVIDVVKTPEAVVEDENLIRDEKDRPILRAALDAVNMKNNVPRMN